MTDDYEVECDASISDFIEDENDALQVCASLTGVASRL